MFIFKDFIIQASSSYDDFMDYTTTRVTAHKMGDSNELMYACKVVFEDVLTKDGIGYFDKDVSDELALSDSELSEIGKVLVDTLKEKLGHPSFMDGKNWENFLS